MDKNKEQEIKDFLNFIIAEAKSKGKDPNAYAKELGEDGMKEAYKRFQALKLKKAQKALHGAKLQYFRILKNQCPEGEELYYYKKGGSVGCGCKKKEGGGEVVTKASNGTVAKFKAERMQNPSRPIRTKAQQREIDKQSEEDAINGTYGLNQKQINKLNNPKQKSETYPIKNYDKNLGSIKRTITYREPVEKNDTTFYRINKDGKSKFSSSNNGDRNQYKKDEGRFNASKSEAPIKKKATGSKIVKTFKEKCGSKMKKHQLGGSLNGIPFMLKGDKTYTRGEVYEGPKTGIRTLYRTNPDQFGRIESHLRIITPRRGNTFKNDTIYKRGFFNPVNGNNINWTTSDGTIFNILEKLYQRKQTRK